MGLSNRFFSNKSWAFMAGVIAFGAIGGAGAQPAPTDGVPPPIELNASQEAELSPQQQVAKGREYVNGMARSSAVVRRQLSEARQARDVVKVLCLNDKLNQIDVALRSARDRLNTLKGAVERNEAERSRHEFTILSVLNDRVRTLVSEANQCIGEETGFVGDSSVTVDIDPSIPDTDPVDLPIDSIISQPPVAKSPIR